MLCAEFEGKKFVSVSKGDVKLEETEVEKKRQKKLNEIYKPLIDWFKDYLGSRASKVEISKRLVTDPATVSSTHGEDHEDAGGLSVGHVEACRIPRGWRVEGRVPVGASQGWND